MSFIPWRRTAQGTWSGRAHLAAVVLLAAAIVLAILYGIYRLADPLPPRHFIIAAGIAGSGYDSYAKRYAAILARDGVELEIRHSAGAVEDLDLLRDGASGVQAALVTLGFTQAGDAEHLASLGGVADAVVFVFYRNAEPVTQFAQFRGKRLAIGTIGTGIRPLILQVLETSGAVDASTTFANVDYDAAVDALIAGSIDVAIFPAQLNSALVQRLLGAPGIRLMNVAQAETIAKTVPGFKRVVLSRGLVNLPGDVPDTDVDMLATGNALLVRKELHPALQFLLLQAIREVHRPPGPFNRLGEFPAEQPNDLPLSATAERFYRAGPTFWQQYTSFWLASLLDRIVFFVIPVVAALTPIIGFAPRVYRWLGLRRIARLHRALGRLERELAAGADRSVLAAQRARLAEIEAAVHRLDVPSPFAIDLHRLRIHLRMVQDQVGALDASAT